MPQRAYEGDEVTIRCSAYNNGEIMNLVYYKDGYQLSAYSGASNYIISNARTSDSGSYYCKANRNVLWILNKPEETKSVWLHVQGEGLILPVDESGKE